MNASRRPTFDELYADIEQLPANLVGEILEPGVLHTMARPGEAHRRATRHCMSALARYDRNIGGSGWWIESEMQILLPDDRLVVPDLAGWRVERVPNLPDENQLSVVPDWCCEMLSPSTARDDKRIKLPLYARSGVAWSWIVDPEGRLLEVYETANGVATLRLTAKDDDELEVPPFDGPLSLADWWLAPST